MDSYRWSINGGSYKVMDDRIQAIMDGTLIFNEIFEPRSDLSCLCNYYGKVLAFPSHDGDSTGGCKKGVLVRYGGSRNN